jgi:heavy metal translocating P-type ATPase
VVFTPVTLVMCALAFLISGQPTAVVAVLVVATPCPLILATPVAIISGINRAARHGIIVKGGTAIERIGQATAVVFDKTGTLTAGTPVVERIEALDGYQTETILRLSAGLEQLSSHPMARALVSAGHDRYAELPLPQDVVEAAGQGVSGQVEGHMVNVGSSSFAAEKGLATTDELARARAAASAEGASTAMVGIDGKVAGLVVYADRLRQPVPGMLARLQSLGVTETAMLTGDDALTAQAIAEEAGITTVRSDLLPSQKVDAVREVLERHRTVVMVGDGINDAPALATATVGIALGAHGAAVSAEAADIVITTDDVSRVASAVEIGQRTLHIAKQSIWVGLSLSTSMMVLAALGLILPAQGAVLQEALDVAVILNALRAR